MLIFKANASMNGEEYDRWRSYLESKEPSAVLLPAQIDFICDPSESCSLCIASEEDETNEE